MVAKVSLSMWSWKHWMGGALVVALALGELEDGYSPRELRGSD